jgi:hypothetical protein
MELQDDSPQDGLQADDDLHVSWISEINPRV